jgi:hypothetical protein
VRVASEIKKKPPVAKELLPASQSITGVRMRQAVAEGPVRLGIGALFGGRVDCCQTAAALFALKCALEYINGQGWN